jgi:iron complex outermembrane recepter protein
MRMSKMPTTPRFRSVAKVSSNGLAAKLLSATIAALCTASAVGTAVAASPAETRGVTYKLDLPSQSLDDALRAVALASKHKLLYSTQLVEGKSSPALKGEFTTEEAVERLLEGTDLRYEVTPDGLVLIRGKDEAGEGSRTGSNEHNSAAGADSLELEEIIVTATRRAERLQDVPASIQAVGEEQLQRLGADDFADYARTVAGLSFSDRGPSRNQIVIRGITTGVEYDNGKQSTVAVYVDEVPVTEGMAQPDLKLFDVDRVEVLRGPQGTLYGSGSMGGTVRIITAQPDPDNLVTKGEATLSTTKHGGTNVLASGALNIPLASGISALRLVGYYRDEDGYIDNVALGKENVNDERTYGGRAALRVSPSDVLDITGTMMYQQQKVGGVQEAETAYGELDQFRLRAESGRDEITIYNLNVDWDVGFANLVSSSSLFKRERVNEYDNSAFPVLDPLPIFADNFYDSDSFTQELRLTSTGEQRLRWLVGAFYQDSDGDGRQITNIPGIGDLLGLPDDIAYNGRGANNVKQSAIFGELNFDITSKLTFTTGARYSKYDLEASNSAFGFIAGGTEDNPAVDQQKTSDEAVTPKFNLSYKPHDDLLFYGQVAKGFRIGGVNFIPPSTDPSDLFVPRTFGSDELWNYEIGAKTTLAPGVTLNSALFYIDWTNIQIGLIRDSDGSAYIGNAGSAVIKGFELELVARPTHALELALATTYNDARVTEDQPSIGAENGERIPTVPKWSGSGSAQYSFPLSDRLGAYVRSDVQYVGKSYNNFVERDEQGDYTLVNARFGVELDAWEVSAFVNNLFDERGRLFVDRLLSNEKVNVNRPRTIGITARKRF